MNVELDENEVRRLILAIEDGQFGQPELAIKLRHALNGPKVGAWPENLGRAIHAEFQNALGAEYPALIAHVSVMYKEHAITAEQRDRLMTAIDASKAKPLVDQGWRDVAADAIREGAFAKAIQVIIREDPKAWPYIQHLETVKDKVKGVLRFQMNAAGRSQDPEFHEALEALRVVVEENQ